MTMTMPWQSRVLVDHPALEFPGLREWIEAEALRRHSGGDRRAAKEVALDRCQSVWDGTASRPLANEAYRRALKIGRAAIAAGAQSH